MHNNSRLCTVRCHEVLAGIQQIEKFPNEYELAGQQAGDIISYNIPLDLVPQYNMGVPRIESAPLLGQ